MSGFTKEIRITEGYKINAVIFNSIREMVDSHDFSDKDAASAFESLSFRAIKAHEWADRTIELFDRCATGFHLMDTRFTEDSENIRYNPIGFQHAFAPKGGRSRMQPVSDARILCTYDLDIDEESTIIARLYRDKVQFHSISFPGEEKDLKSRFVEAMEWAQAYIEGQGQVEDEKKETENASASALLGSYFTHDGTGKKYRCTGMNREFNSGYYFKWVLEIMPVGGGDPCASSTS